MNIKTNAIVNYNGTEPTELPNGYSVGILTSQGNINISGISTIETISGTSLNSSTISVTSMNGDGSGLTNLPSLQNGRVIALKYIFADPPLRS